VEKDKASLLWDNYFVVRETVQINWTKIIPYIENWNGGKWFCVGDLPENEGKEIEKAIETEWKSHQSQFPKWICDKRAKRFQVSKENFDNLMEYLNQQGL
jgi:hypothetical protein